MAFFYFSKIAAVRHLGFLVWVIGPPTKAFGGLYHCTKFGWSRCSSFDNMQVLVFCDSGLKTPIHAPFGRVFWGHISPQNVTRRPNAKKDRPWAEARHLSHKA